MLSEFRDSRGALRAFEVGHQFTTFSAFCGALAQMPGVRFENGPKSLWSPRSGRFTFKGYTYEVSIPHSDPRVAPMEPGTALPATEEILAFVKQSLLPKWTSRLRSRFLTT
jgi:hypothetical protein